VPMVAGSLREDTVLSYKLAAEMIEASASDQGIAMLFRMSRMSANRWRRTLAVDGRVVLEPRGPADGQCKLTAGQVPGLEVVLRRASLHLKESVGDTCRPRRGRLLELAARKPGRSRWHTE